MAILAVTNEQPIDTLTLLNRPSQRARGFTLIELMVAVVIVGLLMAIAIPYVMQVRKKVVVRRFANDIRVVADAFNIYAFEQGEFPPDAPSSTMPNGMDGYLRGFPWTLETPIGGSWDWQNDPDRLGVAVIEYTVAEGDLQAIDEYLDDGDLTTGSLTGNASLCFFALTE